MITRIGSKQTLKIKIIRNRTQRRDTYNLIVVIRIDVHDSLRFGLKIEKGLGFVGSCSTKGFMNGQAFRFRLLLLLGLGRLGLGVI